MNWPLAQITEVARVVGGGTPKSGREEYWDGDVLWTTPKDLTNLDGKFISETPRKITGEGLRSCSAELLPANSVLFSSRAPIGHVAINTVPMATNQGFKSFVPNERIDASFLYWWLDANRSHLKAMGTGATFKEVSKATVERIQIPLPPLEEQRRIAGILDQADALRRLRTRALDKLNTLGQAIFHEMFGDVRSEGVANCTLGNCAEFYSGNTLPDGEEYDGQEGGYLVLKVSDLNRPANAREVWEAASWSAAPGSKASTCPAGAIVFPKRGGAIGTNKKRILMRPAVLDPNLMGVVPRLEFVTTDFLSGWFSLFTLSDIASGSSVPQLNKQDLTPLRLKVPDLKSQGRFAKQRNQLQLIWEQATAELKQHELLFASLQHRAFREEL